MAGLDTRESLLLGNPFLLRLLGCGRDRGRRGGS